MESKYIRVSEKKAEEKIDFYTAFGWTLVGEREQLPNGKVGLTFERDKKELESFDKIRRAEQAYAQISRPYPLAALITLAIGSALLILYFVLQKQVVFYLGFLYLSLFAYAMSIYLLIIFIIIVIKRRGLQNKIVQNVGAEAGTIRELPLKNNIEKENEDTWLIANNL